MHTLHPGTQPERGPRWGIRSGQGRMVRPWGHTGQGNGGAGLGQGSKTRPGQRGTLPLVPQPLLQDGQGGSEARCCLRGRCFHGNHCVPSHKVVVQTGPTQQTTGAGEAGVGEPALGAHVVGQGALGDSKQRAGDGSVDRLQGTHHV